MSDKKPNKPDESEPRDARADSDAAKAPDEGASPPLSPEVARALGGPSPGSEPSATDGEAALRGEEGRLQLDKAGRLASRPPLEPVKAHREDDPAGAGDDASEASEDAGKPEGEQGAPRKATLPPTLASLRPEGFTGSGATPDASPPKEVEEIVIPAGTFLFGEGQEPTELPAFTIDKYPVTNADYERFVAETSHRPPLYWPHGHLPPDLADHPVVGVDYYDAMAYAEWKGKDLPFEDEWERAARGTDGRTYPWGNEQELSGANTARTALKVTVPVDFHKTNVSPEGCCDMVGNAWEMTHSPAPGGGVVVRGGSWYDFALYAKTFFRFATRPDARNGTIGFRCCRRSVGRDDAAREVDPLQVQAEITARRGPQAPIDPSEFSAERRDLVPDLMRLRLVMAEARTEEMIAPLRGHDPSSVVSPLTPKPASSDEEKPEEPAATPAAKPPESGPPEAVTSEAVTPEAVAAEAVTPEAVAGEEERPPAPAATPPVAADRLELQQAAEKAASAPTTAAPADAAPKRMPVFMWVLLACGLVLCIGLIAALVPGDADDPGAPTAPPVVGPLPVPRNPLLDVPEAPPYGELDTDQQEPQVVDAGSKTGIATLERGVWLLVFADPKTIEGEQSLMAAHKMHRRVGSSGVHVAVVLLRAQYAGADGALPGQKLLAERLRTAGSGFLWDGIHVVFDPPADDEVPDGRGTLQARLCRADEPVTAVLLNNGRRDGHTSPPGGGFRPRALARIVLRALELAPGP